jgi:hypothetical protein
MSDQKTKEKIMEFICLTCKTAKDVCYDAKGDSLDEDIYFCSKCKFYFVVSAICNKCNGVHSRSYGCNNRGCGCLEYHYDHNEMEIKT